jgi:hypothetical protein
MAGTRSSTRNTGSSPAKSDDAVAGSKRKPEAEPSPKRSRKATKKQATLEESGITNEDSEMKDASDPGQEKQSEPEAAKDDTNEQDNDKNGNEEQNVPDDAVKAEERTT